jgi:hypothetical protein
MTGEVHLQKHKIDRSEVKLEIVVEEEPLEAGIDPYIKLIDRNPDDNLKRAERTE